jgi:WhiB family transcriptional regulator, redox-sensing transcriptional regulator
MSAKGVAKHRHNHDIGRWADQAACKGTNVNLWFPENSGRHPSSHQQAILELCHHCPVRMQCLEHAIVNCERGIWGGLNETQRQNIRRTRR